MPSLSDEIYGGREPWELELYTPFEAARHVNIPISTAYYWLEAEARFVGLASHGRRLNFKNLIELYVLNALRNEHGAPLRKISRGVKYLRKNFDSKLIFPTFNGRG